MEASGTSNMKFSMNGCVLIGTLDGANVEIRQEVGEENLFLFGAQADEIACLRRERAEGKVIILLPMKEMKSHPVLFLSMFKYAVWPHNSLLQFVPDPRFEEVKAFVRSGVFGPYNYEELIGSLEGNEGFGRADYFLVGKDFPSYIECQEEVDKAYTDQEVFLIILSCLKRVKW